ncbi:hypothetical protein GA707_08225 [Nostocoides sp. F2B08]|uniref:(d)CMP kinase n=1 Tax=Nostocoides sp. F2B08 TaxID=2653936 RepID=UPI0012636B48|nr:(d)CMP kinase [Tetrasphaera sp. F2B08]KAB7744582.1 hypothetical protein GA707_08225 [Tetrasphaera sp. F2B08]
MWDQPSEPADPAAVTQVLDRVAKTRPRCGAVRVVAVDGRSGSGKTTLARAVAAALQAPVVHMDRLYPGWDGLAASVPILVSEILAPLAEEVSAAYRVWDWHRDRWNGREHLAPAPVLVVEGCGSSVGPAGEYAALRVWMEAPRRERLRRGLARDGETYRPHWERWAAQEDRLYAADGTRAKADLVIRTG